MVPTPWLAMATMATIATATSAPATPKPGLPMTAAGRWPSLAAGGVGCGSPGRIPGTAGGGPGRSLCRRTLSVSEGDGDADHRGPADECAGSAGRRHEPDGGRDWGRPTALSMDIQ